MPVFKWSTGLVNSPTSILNSLFLTARRIRSVNSSSVATSLRSSAIEWSPIAAAYSHLVIKEANVSRTRSWRSLLDEVALSKWRRLDFRYAAHRLYEWAPVVVAVSSRHKWACCGGVVDESDWSPATTTSIENTARKSCCPASSRVRSATVRRRTRNSSSFTTSALRFKVTRSPSSRSSMEPTATLMAALSSARTDARLASYTLP